MIRRPFPPDGPAALVAAFAAEVTRLRNLHRARRNRSYPCVVKPARHNQYKVKKATDVGTRHAGPPTLRIANLPPGRPAQQPGRIGAGALNLAA